MYKKPRSLLLKIVTKKYVLDLYIHTSFNYVIVLLILYFGETEEQSKESGGAVSRGV